MLHGRRGNRGWVGGEGARLARDRVQEIGRAIQRRRRLDAQRRHRRQARHRSKSRIVQGVRRRVFGALEKVGSSYPRFIHVLLHLMLLQYSTLLLQSKYFTQRHSRTGNRTRYSDVLRTNELFTGSSTFGGR